MPEKTFSPREFLKARRPEKFSDSVLEETPALDRSLLEYHLDTLTSRSQEALFENFARTLAQYEVCPNLLPHTGPTGGGDSKVDAETYPVADALSLGWYTGLGREAANERWAFAFSAMKKWRPKVESDIAKISAAGRGYSKAFFISNQFVPDRVRAEVEDQLRTTHRIDVRLFDKTWILDRVFAGRHEKIAIDQLQIQTSIRHTQRKGPLDFKKENELEVVETRIKQAIERGTTDGLFVADCLAAGELARGLELPRTEVDGRLLRAKRAAEEHGTAHQQLLSAYQWAWTEFWWYEDYKAFSERYSEAEQKALKSNNAYALELVFNLWCNLRMLVLSGHLTSEHTKLDRRTRVLAFELDCLKGQRERASSALHAESLRLLMDLISTPPEQCDPLLKAFEGIVDRSQGLVGFPLAPLVQILTDAGDFLLKRPAYDSLWDKVVATVAQRSGEVAAARMLLHTGAQSLDADQPYRAVQSLGKALMRLYKHESRNDLVKALFLCGNAYANIGLQWAARGSVLTAASIAVNDFWTYEEVTPQQAACFKRLKWIELQLGRLPHCLVWHETADAAQDALRNQGYHLENYLEDKELFDVCLAILLLRSDLWQLKQLAKLPQTLDSVELSIAAAALRFALGHDCNLPSGFGVKQTEVLGFFEKLRNQPAAAEISEKPLLYNERKVTLKSRVLGCSITLTSENRSPCIELAESILAAMEALLSTGLEHRLFAREPVLQVNVCISDFAASPFAFEFDERDGLPFFEIRCAEFHAHKMACEHQLSLKEKLSELLISILARIFVIDPSEEQFRKLFQDELGLERAIDFTSSFITSGNVLGYIPKTNLDSWIKAESQEFQLTRSEEWDSAERNAKPATAAKEGFEIQIAKEQQPCSDKGKKASHTDMTTISLIRLPLWERANWMGTLFMWPLEENSLPLLGIMFRDGEAGREIFAHWQNELGKTDKENRLRITIIRGIDRTKIYAYRVVIASNRVPTLSGSEAKLFFMVTRMNTMEPNSDRNLTEFIAKYNKTKAFILAPAILPDGDSEPKIIVEKSILKRELHIREAWQIARNDQDAPGLRPDDEPIIPDGCQDAPVLGVIAWLKECERLRA